MADETPDLHALAAAYALDALEPDERRRFEAHYPSCPTCSVEVGEFRETAARLTGGELAAPPADMKARVMADVARTRQLPPRVTPITAARSRMPMVALAAAALVLVLIGIGAVLSTRDGGSGTSDELAALLAAPDAVTVQLEGEADGTLRVVYSAERDEAVLVGSGLATPGDERTYQLWTIAGEQPASAGVFDPDDDGELDQPVELPTADPDAWAVTIEPEGGSPAPTSDILFQGTAV